MSDSSKTKKISKATRKVTVKKMIKDDTRNDTRNEKYNKRLEKKFKGLDLNTFRVKEWKGELIFLYEIIKGLAESSYGIQVGKMAGLPLEVTDLALNILSKLEQNDHDFLETSNQLKLSFNKNKKETFDDNNLVKIINEIKSIDINEVSPLEAFQKLEEIQEKLKET